MYFYNIGKMKHIGINIKEIRKEKGLLQKEVAAAADLHPANYNKIEKGEREPSVKALTKIAALFAMTVDQIIHYEGEVPHEVTIEDKTTAEKLQLIQQLPDEDRNALFHMIDTMLTKAKFKDFFNKNVATL